jgi:hypothetical protein
MQLYLHQNGQQLGPFTEAEIRAKLADGTAGTQDLVWWEGQPGWVLLGATPIVINASLPPAAATAPPTVPGVVASAMTPGVPVATPGTSGLAIGSLVCGVSSLLVGITFIPAIVLGHLALSRIRETPGLKGRGMAITGLVIGYAWPVLAFVAIVAISVLIALGQQVQGIFSNINSQLQQAQGS